MFRYVYRWHLRVLYCYWASPTTNNYLYLYIKQVYYCNTHSYDENLRTYHYRIIFHIIEFDLARVLYYKHINIKLYQYLNTCSYDINTSVIVSNNITLIGPISSGDKSKSINLRFDLVLSISSCGVIPIYVHTPPMRII